MRTANARKGRDDDEDWTPSYRQKKEEDDVERCRCACVFDLGVNPSRKEKKEHMKVIFISKETINLDGKTFVVDHFKLKSKNKNLDDDKKLDFDIWLNTKNNIIVKVEYNRLGKWQYILKNVEKN